MAWIIKVPDAPSGMASVTIELVDASDVLEVAISLTEKTNAKRLYEGTIPPGTTPGDYSGVVKSGTDVMGGFEKITLVGDPEVVTARDMVNTDSDSSAISAVYVDTQYLVTQVGLAGAGLTDLGGMSTAMKAEVKAEADTAITDVLESPHAEPTGVPAANETVVDKIGYLYLGLRNQIDVSATKKTFYGDDGVAEFEKDLSDDGTTYTESEANAI